MKKLLILSTLLLCLTANPKTFSAEEKNKKTYRCIEFWDDDDDDDDDDEYPQYAIAESDITLERWINWLNSNDKVSDHLKLYNKETVAFDALTGDSYREKEKEKYKNTFEENKYLFTRETIKEIFKKEIIINRAKEVVSSPGFILSFVKFYLLLIKNADIEIAFEDHMAMPNIATEVEKILKNQETDEPKTDNEQKQNTPSPVMSIVRPLKYRIEGSSTSSNEESDDSNSTSSNQEPDDNSNISSNQKPDNISNTSSNQEPDNNSSTSSNEEPGNNSNISSNQEPDDNSSTSSRINYHIGAIFIIIGATLSSLIQKRKKSPKKKKSSNEENVENTI